MYFFAVLFRIMTVVALVAVVVALVAVAALLVVVLTKSDQNYTKNNGIKKFFNLAGFLNWAKQSPKSAYRIYSRISQIVSLELEFGSKLGTRV